MPDDEFDGWKLILQNGGTITQIAQRYHRTYDQVHYHLSKVGLVPKGCNKLTWQQAAAIRENASPITSLSDCDTRFASGKFFFVFSYKFNLG